MVKQRPPPFSADEETISSVVSFDEPVPGPLSYEEEQDALWADTVPLFPPPLPHPVVCIASDPRTARTMGLFWAAKQRGDTSQRVLDLTREIILHVNSAHYSVWAWRFRCLQARLGGAGEGGGGPRLSRGLLEGERALVAAVAADGPKNYQLWNHRRRCALAAVFGVDEAGWGAWSPGTEEGGGEGWIGREECIGRSAAESKSIEPSFSELEPPRNALSEALGSSAPCEASRVLAAELEFSSACLALDAKNYHCWAHRGAMLCALGGPVEWRHELQATEAVLAEDPRNNSAWAHRVCVWQALLWFQAVREGEWNDLERAPPQDWRRAIFPHLARLGDLDPGRPPSFAWALARLPSSHCLRLGLAQLDAELDAVLPLLHRAPHSASAWTYLLRWAARGRLATTPRLEAAAKAALERAPGCAPALEALREVVRSQLSALEGVGGDRATQAFALLRERERQLSRRLVAADPVKARLLA